MDPPSAKVNASILTTVATPRKTTRRGSFLIALAIVVAALGVYMLAPQFLMVAELGLYNQQFRLRGPLPGNDQVVIVAIDEPSLGAIGRWPWPRSVLAERFKALGVGGAAVREVERERRDADHDRKLADAIAASGRVVLASTFTVRQGAPTKAPVGEGQPVKSALASFKHRDERSTYPPPSADAMGVPIPPLLAAATSLGHVNMLPDSDGTTRWELLVIEHKGHYYPSLALETVRVAAGIDPFALRLDFGRAVELGAIAIPIDPRARVLVDYAGPNKTFTYIPAASLLRGDVPAERLKDRIVFVGATAEGTYDLRVTPFSPVLPGVEKHANMAANILAGRFIIRPAWVELVEAGGILVFPLLLGWILPRLRPVTSVGATVLLGAGFIGATHVAFRQGLWLPAVYPSLAIALTFVGITVYRFLTEERQRLWTKRAFQQYVSPEVVEQMVEDPAALQFGGELRPLTVLFSDIRDFTTFTERHDPQEVVQMLREYLTRMTDCVLK